MMLVSQVPNPIVLAQIGFGTCDPGIIELFYEYMLPCMKSSLGSMIPLAPVLWAVTVSALHNVPVAHYEHRLDAPCASGAVPV